MKNKEEPNDMKKNKILTITIATLTAITITITAAITFTRNANAAEICNSLENDCHGFYYDLDGIRYNAAGLKEIANDVNEKGTDSKYYKLLLKDSQETYDPTKIAINHGKVLINKTTYKVNVYRTQITNPDWTHTHKLVSFNDARDASRTKLAFVIDDNFRGGNHLFIGSSDEIKTKIPEQELQHLSWRDSNLRKVVNSNSFINQLPSELKQQIAMPVIYIGQDYVRLAKDTYRRYDTCQDEKSTAFECYNSTIDKLIYGQAEIVYETGDEYASTGILFSL